MHRWAEPMHWMQRYSVTNKYLCISLYIYIVCICLVGKTGLVFHVRLISCAMERTQALEKAWSFPANWLMLQVARQYHRIIITNATNPVSFCLWSIPKQETHPKHILASINRARLQSQHDAAGWTCLFFYWTWGQANCKLIRVRRHPFRNAIEYIFWWQSYDLNPS